MRDPLTVHGFFPPFLYQRLARSRKKALHNLGQRELHAGGYLRAQRDAASAPRPVSAYRGGAAAVPPPAAVGEALQIPHYLFRRVHDANNTFNLPGNLARHEHSATVPDPPAVDEAFLAMGATFQFFHQLFSRNSLDDAGMPLIASVRVAWQRPGGQIEPMCQALWDGDQALFGEGDGTVFQRFTRSIDVVAHELVHGLQNSLGRDNRLISYGESGALQEHFCDVFGVLVRLWNSHQNGKPEQGDERWLLARDVLTPAPTRKAGRDMKRPGTAWQEDPILGDDRQVGHMEDFYDGYDDNGGMHINSGIPNRAFVLAAEAIGGDPWVIPGKIWYRTLRQLPATARFADCKRLTVAEAQQSYGQSIAQLVDAAWNAVGVR
jgi:Zn-dependent metalloprotease